VAKTLEEIARLAEVSRSTVSRVVNQHPNVRPAVRQRVQKIIAETGYQPNAAARSLAFQRSNVIGLAIPRSVHTLFTDPYFPPLTQGIAQACNQYGYILSLFVEFDEQTLFPRITRQGLLDGLVVQVANTRSNLLAKLASVDMPFIVAGRPHDAPNVSYIDVDNITGAYNAVTHLIRLGHKRIGAITGPLDTTAALDRLEGYRKAILERGLALDEDLIGEGDFTETGGYHAMQRLLGQKPSAVFAASDAMAYGALRALREAGLAVPHDVALVGFDDVPCAGTDPSFLTTVRQPIISFGFKAVEILLDVIEHGAQPPRRILMSTELVVRASCGAQQNTRRLGI
jgi:LacI family transcriptional regulator